MRNTARFIKSPRISWTVVDGLSVTVSIGKGFQFLIKTSPRRNIDRSIDRCSHRFTSLLPLTCSSSSRWPISPSNFCRMTLVISWNFVWDGRITNPSWRTLVGHWSRVTTQWTGRNLLFNARPKGDAKKKSTQINQGHCNVENRNECRREEKRREEKVSNEKIGSTWGWWVCAARKNHDYSTVINLCLSFLSSFNRLSSVKNCNKKYSMIHLPYRLVFIFSSMMCRNVEISSKRNKYLSLPLIRRETLSIKTIISFLSSSLMIISTNYTLSAVFSLITFFSSLWRNFRSKLKTIV